jgi:FkbM family methyltransferase
MCDNDLITFQTIIKLIKNIYEDQLKNLITKIEYSKHFSHITKMVYEIIRQSLGCLNLELTYMPKIREKYLFYNLEKQYCYDFLIYCLMHGGDLFFDLRYFANEDRKEILKFIRNKIYGALLDSVEKCRLFDELDLKYESMYKNLNRKIKKKGKSYVLLNKNEYFLPINHFEPVVFYHKYGIQEIPNFAKESMSEKDIIDAGAFIGDSALILNELNPRRIYAFEPLKENVLLLRKTIELNNLRNIIVIEKALGSKEGISYIFPSGSASFISKQGKKIELTTIDDFVCKNSLKIGLIKMDVEGYEPEIIRGAELTIKKEKPILIVSLYHTGEEFFEIPKLLKSWVPEYEFRFLNLNRTSATFERVLIAYISQK